MQQAPGLLCSAAAPKYFPSGKHPYANLHTCAYDLKTDAGMEALRQLIETSDSGLPSPRLQPGWSNKGHLTFLK
jgi:hypothetical protein